MNYSKKWLSRNQFSNGSESQPRVGVGFVEAKCLILETLLGAEKKRFPRNLVGIAGNIWIYNKKWLSEQNHPNKSRFLQRVSVHSVEAKRSILEKNWTILGTSRDFFKSRRIIIKRMEKLSIAWNRSIATERGKASLAVPQKNGRRSETSLDSCAMSLASYENNESLEKAE